MILSQGGSAPAASVVEGGRSLAGSARHIHRPTVSRAVAQPPHATNTRVSANRSIAPWAARPWSAGAAPRCSPAGRRDGRAIGKANCGRPPSIARRAQVRRNRLAIRLPQGPATAHDDVPWASTSQARQPVVRAARR